MKLLLEDYLRSHKQYQDFFGHRVGKEFHGRVYKRKHFAKGDNPPHRLRRKLK